MNEDDRVERRQLEGQVRTTEWAVECSSTCGKGFVCSESAAGGLVVNFLDGVSCRTSPLYMSYVKKDTRVTGQVLEVARDSRPALHLHPYMEKSSQRANMLACKTQSNLHNDHEVYFFY